MEHPAASCPWDFGRRREPRLPRPGGNRGGAAASAAVDPGSAACQLGASRCCLRPYQRAERPALGGVAYEVGAVVDEEPVVDRLRTFEIASVRVPDELYVDGVRVQPQEVAGKTLQVVGRVRVLARKGTAFAFSTLPAVGGRQPERLQLDYKPLIGRTAKLIRAQRVAAAGRVVQGVVDDRDTSVDAAARGTCAGAVRGDGSAWRGAADRSNSCRTIRSRSCCLLQFWRKRADRSADAGFRAHPEPTAAYQARMSASCRATSLDIRSSTWSSCRCRSSTLDGPPGGFWRCRRASVVARGGTSPAPLPER